MARPRKRYGGPSDADRDKDPRSLADLVPTLVAGRGWNERMALGRLRSAWAEVVGPTLAERSAPVALARGTLTVRAEGGVWATELTLLRDRLAAKADDFLAPDARVRRVEIASGMRGSGGSR